MGEVQSLEERRRKNAARQRRFRERHGSVPNPAGFVAHCWVCGDEFRTLDRDVRVCGEGGCAREQRRKRLKPFTVAHFRRWALGVTLDNGKPWKLEPFHERFLEDLFGGVPECWLVIGEGNTKTTFFGGIALYHCQYRRNGRVPVAAASRDQAMEMFHQMEAMVADSETLQPLFLCQEGYRRIKCPSMSSRMQIFAADERTGDGAIFTLALLDELHRQRDMRLYRVWTGKRRKRGGQIAAISTAGEPGGEFEQIRQEVRTASTRVEVSRGYVRSESKTMVLHDYSVPDNGNPESMSDVKLANPFSGITLESLREKRDSPTMTTPHWLRFTCNRATRGFAAAITESEWFRQRTDITIPTGVPIWAGLDVAWKDDTTAIVPYWMRDPEFALLGAATILTPPRNGDMLDPEEVTDALLEIHEQNPIHTLVMDMSLAATIAAWAVEHLGCEVVDRVQKPVPACQDYARFMDWFRNRWLWHTGDEGLTQHAMNAASKLYPDGQTRFIRPSASRKTDQEHRVIDALTAGSMVHSTAVAELEVEQTPILVAMV